PRILRFSPGGKTIAVGHDDGVVQLWSLPDHLLAHRFVRPQQTITALGFSQDGASLLGAAADRSVTIWGIADDSVRSIVLPDEPAVDLTSYKDRFLAAMTEDGLIHFIDTAEMKNLAELNLQARENDDSRWILATPDGFFDSSEGEWRNILWRYLGQTFDVVPT